MRDFDFVFLVWRRWSRIYSLTLIFIGGHVIIPLRSSSSLSLSHPHRWSRNYSLTLIFINLSLSLSHSWMEREGITEEERLKIDKVNLTDGYDHRDQDQDDDRAKGDEGSRNIKKLDSFDIETTRFKSDYGHSSNQVSVFPGPWKSKKKNKVFLS